MKYTVIVFEDNMLVEECSNFMEHFVTAMAFGDEPGYLGSSTVPEGVDIPSHEEMVNILMVGNADAVRLRELEV